MTLYELNSITLHRNLVLFFIGLGYGVTRICDKAMKCAASTELQAGYDWLMGLFGLVW